MERLLLPLLPWILSAWFLVVLVGAGRAAGAARTNVLGVVGTAAANVVLYYPLYVILALLCAAAVGIAYRNGVFAAYAGIGLPVSIALAVVSRRIRRQGGIERATEAALLAVLPRTDYYWIAGDTGIAVDAASRTVALACGRAGIQCYPLGAIRHAQAIQQELSQTRVYGRGVVTYEARQQADRDNLRAELANAQATGLVLELNDVAMPSLHITMPYRGAEQWLRLLEQLEEGTLTPCAAPARLPAR